MYIVLLVWNANSPLETEIHLSNQKVHSSITKMYDLLHKCVCAHVHVNGHVLYMH